MFCSYEAERKMISKHDKNVNYKEIWDNRVQLLSFSVKEGKPNNMSNLTLIYPSVTFSKIVDPMKIASQKETEQLKIEEIINQAENEIKRLMKPIIEKHSNKDGNIKDERWYWASLALLDKNYNYELVNNWLNNNEDSAWSKMIESKGNQEDGAFKEHINLFNQYLNQNHQLGEPPEDLIEVLTKIAIAAPATTALRAYKSLLGKDNPKDFSRDLMTSAARTAIDFRSMFNLPDATYLIRGLSNTGDKRYWESVLDYCINGNLQAVLDEYIHVLRETNGLTNKASDYILEQIREEINESLTIRSAALEFDEIITEPELNLKDRRIRCRFVYMII